MLTPRQAAFARNLLTGGSAAQAARDAGYSPLYADRQAHKLMLKPHIAALVDELKQKAEDDSVMTAREVLKRLTAIARGEGEIARSTPGGLMHLPPDWSDRQRALDALAKHHGLLTERREITLRKAPSDMTDAELDEALADVGLTD